MRKFVTIILVTIIPFVALISCTSTGEVAGEPEIQEEVSVLEDGLSDNSGEAVNESPEVLDRLPEQEGENYDPVGTWLWRNGPSVYLYIFEDDGSGIRGFFCDGLDSNFVPQVEEFQWIAGEGVLTLDFGRESVELWSIEISNGILDLTSRQIAGLEYSYVRLIEDEYDNLIGVWNWEEDISWFYEFNPYGRGSRPAFPAGRENFDWAITADEGLVMFVDDGLMEMWSFVIQEDILTISSRQIEGLEYIYISSRR